MDIRLGMGVRLPPAQEGHRLVGGHVQIEDQIGPGQSQLRMLKVVQPPEELPPLLRGAFHRLVDRIGGGIAVGENQAAPLIVGPPHLLVRGVPVHRVERGSGVGVDVLWAGAELPVQIHADQRGGGLAVLGKDQLLKFPSRLSNPLTQLLKLGGLAGAVRPLEDNQLSSHHRTPWRPLPATRRPAAFTSTRGSLAMRPMRLGSFFRR